MTIRKQVPPSALALIRAVAERLRDSEARALANQAERATVLDEVPGRMLDISVPDDVALLRIPDGPVKPIPAVHDESGEMIGEVLLWVAAGRLVGVERPWFTDEPPDVWPEVSALVFE